MVRSMSPPATASDEGNPQTPGGGTGLASDTTGPALLSLGEVNRLGSSRTCEMRYAMNNSISLRHVRVHGWHRLMRNRPHPAVNDSAPQRVSYADSGDYGQPKPVAVMAT
jgi:hypothetical protein